MSYFALPQLAYDQAITPNAVKYVFRSIPSDGRVLEPLNPFVVRGFTRQKQARDESGGSKRCLKHPGDAFLNTPKHRNFLFQGEDFHSNQNTKLSPKYRAPMLGHNAVNTFEMNP